MDSRITEVEKIDNGVLVYFDDGEAAIYSAAFLRDHLDEVEKVVVDES